MIDFTFLHAADLHLDSPLRGLDKDAPAARIRRATRDALVNLVDFAIERRMAFVLLAGDLYDGDQKDWHCGQFLVQQLGRLTRETIEVVAISGNHDAEQLLTRKLGFSGMLRADAPETRRLPDWQVAVHGQSFATRAITHNMAKSYPDPVDGWFNIGILHTACGNTEHENYAPCTVADLKRKNYDYWALGHVHTRDILLRDPWIVFPGNLQGRRINEEGARGATLVTVRDGKVQSAEPHAFDVVRWLRLTVDATGAADVATVTSRIRFALDEAVLKADGRLLVVRLTLAGECAAHGELTKSFEETLEQVRAAAVEVAAPHDLWVEDVRLLTRPAIDVAAMQAQPGVVGALVEALAQPLAFDDDLRMFASEQLRKARGELDENHPVHQIANGRIPEELLDRARALVLAELAPR